MCRNVSAEKPTAKEIECRTVSDSTCSERSTGSSSATKIGWPTHPSPRLAMVMPNWVALRKEFRFAMIERATLARRWPRATSVSSCVARSFTSANSAATKNPLNAISPSTSRIFRPMARMSPVLCMALETHLPKDNLQHILQAQDAELAPFAAQHDRQPLPAPLQPSQRHLQPQVFVQEQGGLDVIAHRFGHVQSRLVEQRVQRQQTEDPLAPVAAFPHRQAGKSPLPAQCQRYADRCLGGYGDGLIQRLHCLAHRQRLQVEHAVNHGPLFRRERLRGVLHHQA